MALTRLTNFVAGTKILSAAVNSEFNSYLTFINNLIHKDGSVAMIADLELNYATPAILWDGTESSAVQWRIIENAGDFSVQYESTGWQNFMVMNSSPASMILPSALTLTLGNISIEDGDPYVEWSDTEKWRISQDSAGDLLVEIDNAGSFDEVAKFDAATEGLEIQNNLTVGTNLTVTNNLTVSGDTDTSAGLLTMDDNTVYFQNMNYRLVGSNSVSLRTTPLSIEIAYDASAHSDLTGTMPVVSITSVTSGREVMVEVGVDNSGGTARSVVRMTPDGGSTAWYYTIWHIQSNV